MDMKFSEKAEQLDAGIFAVLNEKKNELVKQGRTIYNLSVGTPDFPPMPHIMEAVSEAARRRRITNTRSQSFRSCLMPCRAFIRSGLACSLRQTRS